MNTHAQPTHQPESGQLRDLQILDELANNDALTQRDLSKRLGIALGLVNSYIKNLAAKGYITVKAIPPKRYAYYLTPTGFAEKTRLTYHLLQDYTRIYREAKNNYRTLFHTLEQEGIRTILFAGSDEVAEFAYITLQESDLELVGVVDDDHIGEKFFGREVQPITAVIGMPCDAIIITSFVRRESIMDELKKNEVSDDRIKLIFAME